MTTDTPSPYAQARYHGFERTALAVAVGLFVLTFLLKSVHWDWVFDTAFLIAAALLVKGGDGRQTAFNGSEGAGDWQRRGLLLCSYLFLDAFVVGVATLAYPGIILLVWILLCGLYGAALRLRLREQGIALDSLPWRSLFQQPALFLSLGSLVPLLCMFMPMLHRYYGFQTWSGPFVATMSHSIYMNAGHTINIGSTYVLRGCEVTFGRPVCLLLAGTAAATLLRGEGRIAPVPWLLLARTASVFTLLWWLFAAQGFRSLDYPFNLLFLAGCALLFVASFFRQKAVTLQK